jgi:hypothetical protein
MVLMPQFERRLMTLESNKVRALSCEDWALAVIPMRVIKLTAKQRMFSPIADQSK